MTSVLKSFQDATRVIEEMSASTGVVVIVRRSFQSLVLCPKMDILDSCNTKPSSRLRDMTSSTRADTVGAIQEIVADITTVIKTDTRTDTAIITMAGTVASTLVGMAVVRTTKDTKGTRDTRDIKAIDSDNNLYNLNDFKVIRIRIVTLELLGSLAARGVEANTTYVFGCKCPMFFNKILICILVNQLTFCIELSQEEPVRTLGEFFPYSQLVLQFICSTFVAFDLLFFASDRLLKITHEGTSSAAVVDLASIQRGLEICMQPLFPFDGATFEYRHSFCTAFWII